MKRIKNKIKFISSHMEDKQKFYQIPSDDNGYVLAVSLILLLVITMMGVLALSTSTTEVMLAGNQRLSEVSETSADGGKDIAKPIINDVVYYDRVDTAKFPITIDQNLHNELQINDYNDDGSENPHNPYPENSSDALNYPDIQFTMPKDDPKLTVTVDVDYLFSTHGAGSAIEFASGTEGMGKGMSGGSLIFYKANAFSQWVASQEQGIGTLYRYVVKY